MNNSRNSNARNANSNPKRIENTNKPVNTNTTLSKQVSNAYEKTKEIGEKVKEGVINIKNNVTEKINDVSTAKRSWCSCG